MIISLVVAAATNNAIGKEGQMPWHLPNDMKHFKNVTWGMPVVMGRKTFESLGKALPGRKNIVITRQEGWAADNTVVVKSLEDALFVAGQTDALEVMVIGGGEIYKQSLEIADKIYMPRVHATLDGDTFFPEIDETKWQLIRNQDFEINEKHKYAYSFQTWQKK